MASQTNDRIVESAYEAHAAALHRRLTAITHDPAAAQDLVHDAFMRLLVEARADRTPTNIGGWLFRVGSNLAISRGRRQSVANRRAGDLVVRDAATSPETAVIERETNSTVDDAMTGLPPAVRLALLLAAQGASGSEIARSIGRSEGATRVLLCRARARLRAELQVAGG